MVPAITIPGLSTKEKLSNIGSPILSLEMASLVAELIERAEKGDTEAARYLLGRLSASVERFQKFCADNLKIAKAIVSPGESWPLLHTGLEVRKGYLTVPENHLLRTIKVVKAHRIPDPEKTVTTKIAFWLYGAIEFSRRCSPHDDESKTVQAFRQLPPLSPSTVQKWWKAASPYFVEQWGEDFQENKDFETWSHASYAGMKRREAGSRKRADIKRRIKQGFESIAKSLPVL